MPQVIMPVTALERTDGEKGVRGRGSAAQEDIGLSAHHANHHGRVAGEGRFVLNAVMIIILV